MTNISHPRRSVALAFNPNAATLDLMGPKDVFAAANTLLEPDDGYRFSLVSAGSEPVTLCNGFRIVPDLSFDEASDDYDVILVAGGPAYCSERALCDWLWNACTRARVYGSICAGAFALGDAGLLDGQVVTTHWKSAIELRLRFPSAKVEADRTYIRSGRMISSAGATAGVNLALALVAENHGTDLALRIAQQLIVVSRIEGERAQFSSCPIAAREESANILRVQEHVAGNAGDDYSVAKLAVLAGMSERSFSRHFTRVARTTPREFIERARLDAARRILEGTDQPLKAVAYNCGFGTADNMRRAFQRKLGIAPKDYREKFTTICASNPDFPKDPNS